MADAFSSPPRDLSSRPDPQKPLALSAFTQLIRLQNQSGTLLLVFPSLWSLILASHGQPAPMLVVIFVLGAFLMRSAGVIFNDLADQSIDQKVQRTKQRPLASGVLTSQQALGFGTIIVLLAFGLACLLNPFTIALSPVALLLAAIYPFAKRYIHIPQFILGVAFGWGTVMAWTAVQNQLTLTTWLLFSATICWAISYDTIYALQDKEDDLRIGVKSGAIFFGDYVWLGVTLFSTLTLIFLGTAGWMMSLGSFFYGGLGGIWIFFGYQSMKLTKKQSPDYYFTMFKQHVWVGLAILLAFWIGFW